MTSSVMAFHAGGNKKLVVIVETLQGVPPGNEPHQQWMEVQRIELYGPGQFTPSSILVHDHQLFVLRK